LQMSSFRFVIFPEPSHKFFFLGKLKFPSLGRSMMCILQKESQKLEKKDLNKFSQNKFIILKWF